MHLFVIIPVHNHLSETVRCLDCLARQTFREFSCIVVDDGSTDRTARTLARDYPHVEVLRGDGRLWWAGACARGIERARRTAGAGDFVLLLNNDTEFDADYLQTLVNTSMAHDRALTGSLNVDAADPSRVVDAGIWWDWRTVSSRALPLDPNRDAATGVNTLSGRGTLVPVEVFDAVGGLRARDLPHYAADYEFAMRARRAGFSLAVSYRAVLRVRTDITGREGDLATPLSPADAIDLLRSRKSIRNLRYRLAFVRLACPARYRLRNRAAVLAASLWLLTNVRPIFEVKSALCRRTLPIGWRLWMIRRRLLPPDDWTPPADACAPLAPLDPDDPPRVSVVIPTFNRRAVLQRCLAALARQTYSNLDVIVVDDASTDDTTAMLAVHGDSLRRPADGERHPRPALTVLRNDRNLGANASRNRGIRAASGEIVAFLDSDCIAEPDWAARLVDAMRGENVAAVTGRVDDPPPRNPYELAFAGTNRVHGRGPAPRLVAGNLAVRREPLLRFMFDENRRFQKIGADGLPDTETSGGCDEEGLYLLLRAAGYEQRVAPDAVVLHDHPYDRATFFRQAYYGGGSAARFVRHYRLPPRIDLLPWLLTYLTIPLALFDLRLFALPLLFLIAAVAAVIYNERSRKGKSPADLLRTLPLMIAYYQVRLAGYVVETLRRRSE